MTYHFCFFVGKFTKLFNFSEGMEKRYLVELNVFKENAFYGLQKILLNNFLQNFYIWSAIANGKCIQKSKIGHRAKFRAKSKCFLHILFPVRAILRSIYLPVSLFWFIQLTRASWCRLRARVRRKTLSSLLNNNQIHTDLHTKPTDKHQYHLKKSCHPTHTKRAIPFSVALRLRRICSSINAAMNW